jgi:hypothetical protein
LTDPSYDGAGEQIVLRAALPDGTPLAFAFPTEEAGLHLHGWLAMLQEVADREGAAGLGELSEKMIVLQPTEIAMAGVGPGRGAVVFAFGPVKLAFLVATDQLAALLDATRKEVG